MYDLQPIYGINDKPLNKYFGDKNIKITCIKQVKQSVSIASYC